MGTVGIQGLGAVVGVAWPDMAVGAALVAAIAAFVGAIALSVGRGRRHVEDDDWELPLAG